MLANIKGGPKILHGSASGRLKNIKEPLEEEFLKYQRLNLFFIYRTII